MNLANKVASTVNGYFYCVLEGKRSRIELLGHSNPKKEEESTIISYGFWRLHRQCSFVCCFMLAT